MLHHTLGSDAVCCTVCTVYQVTKHGMHHLHSYSNQCPLLTRAIFTIWQFRVLFIEACMPHLVSPAKICYTAYQ